MASVEDEGFEVVEGGTILDLSTAVHGDRDEGIASRVSVAEGILRIEIERSPAIDCDRTASGSHAVLGIAKDKSTRVHDGGAREGVCRREGRGGRSVLGECTRTGKCSAQGLVGRVGEDKGGVVRDIPGIRATAQQSRDEQCSSRDRGCIGVAVGARKDHDAITLFDERGRVRSHAGRFRKSSAHQEVDPVG